MKGNTPNLWSQKHNKVGYCKWIKVKEPLFLAFYKHVWFNIISWRDNSTLCCVSDFKDLECFLSNQFLCWVSNKLCALVHFENAFIFNKYMTHICFYRSCNAILKTSLNKLRTSSYLDNLYFLLSVFCSRLLLIQVALFTL